MLSLVHIYSIHGLPVLTEGDDHEIAATTYQEPEDAPISLTVVPREESPYKPYILHVEDPAAADQQDAETYPESDPMPLYPNDDVPTDEVIETAGEENDEHTVKLAVKLIPSEEEDGDVHLDVTLLEPEMSEDPSSDVGGEHPTDEVDFGAPGPEMTLLEFEDSALTNETATEDELYVDKPEDCPTGYDAVVNEEGDDAASPSEQELYVDKPEDCPDGYDAVPVDEESDDAASPSEEELYVDKPEDCPDGYDAVPVDEESDDAASPSEEELYVDKPEDCPDGYDAVPVNDVAGDTEEPAADYTEEVDAAQADASSPGETPAPYDAEADDDEDCDEDPEEEYTPRTPLEDVKTYDEGASVATDLDSQAQAKTASSANKVTGTFILAMTAATLFF